MLDSKVACLHIGTHKTGTKALQTFLALNRDALAAAGFLYARADPIALVTQLQQTDDSPALRELLSQAQRSPTRHVIVSCEEFSHLYVHPRALASLAHAFGSAGFLTKIIVYVRAQPTFAESLFIEYVKRNLVHRIEPYLETILHTGVFNPATLDAPVAFTYSALLDPFTQAFGKGNVLLRPYRADREPNYLLADFLAAIGTLCGATIAFETLRNPMPVVNQSTTFRALLATCYDYARQFGSSLPDPERLIAEHTLPTDEHLLDGRPHLITRADALAFLERFREDNRHVSIAHATLIPFISRGDIPPASHTTWDRARVQRALLALAFERWGVKA